MHYFSTFTRGITRLTQEQYDSLKESKEFVNKGHDTLYHQMLHEDRVWTAEQAVRLLARLDPNDHQDPSLLMGSSYNKIKKAIDADHRSGKLSLTESRDMNGNVILVADNVVFIQWAIDKGFNVPEIFVDFLKVFPLINIRKNEIQNWASLKDLEKRWDISPERILQLACKSSLRMWYVVPEEFDIILFENSQKIAERVKKPSNNEEFIYLLDPDESSFLFCLRDLSRMYLLSNEQIHNLYEQKKVTIQEISSPEGDLLTIMPLVNSECFEYPICRDEDVRILYEDMCAFEREDLTLIQKQANSEGKISGQVNKGAALTRSKPQKQKRAHALHEKIIFFFGDADDKSPKAVWDFLRSIAKEGDEVLQDVTSWVDSNAAISWMSHTGKERKMQRATFQNLISKISNKPAK